VESVKEIDKETEMYHLTTLSVAEVIKQSVGNRWMNMGPCWNDNGRGKPQYWEKNLY